MSDDARRRILERRAAFVAACASLAVGACDKPQPCLSVTALPTGETKKQPDAGATGDATVVGPAVCLSESPHPCLDIVPEDARPHPCLSKPRPKDASPTPCLEFVE